MNKPLWQRARKDFIRLVDDDKIPEEHKRLNLHYLRTLPYEAISTAPPLIVEPEPDVMIFRAGQTFDYTFKLRPANSVANALYNRALEKRGLRRTISKPFYRSDGKRMFGDLSDEELKSRFINWLFTNSW